MQFLASKRFYKENPIQIYNEHTTISQDPLKISLKKSKIFSVCDITLYLNEI